MFLFEKYKVYDINFLFFNRDILYQLLHLATYEDIPHVIVSGPPGSGKKTLVKFFLEALYDKEVNNISKHKYSINGSSTKKEIEISQSDYHITIEPTNTNYDKYIIQDIVKKYTMHKSFDIFKAKRKFKTIVIYHLENLAINSQSALRRTMEIYAKSCRFIMVCDHLSKIFDPLRSRCRTICVPHPSLQDITSVIKHIAIMENMDLNKKNLKKILDNCQGDLEKAIWIMDAIRLKTDIKIPLDKVFDTVISLIISVIKSKNIIKIFDDEIRTHIYNILITNIKGSDIITTLMNELIKRIKDDEINLKIIKLASEAELNLVHGRREIINIDYFISHVMNELLKNKEKLKYLLN
jgi:replication factor C subunit 3/5